MIEIKRIDNAKMLLEIDAGAGESAFAAISNGEILGYCIYSLEAGRVILRRLFERDGDIILSDGIVRAVASANRDTADIVVISDECDFGECRSFLGMDKDEIAIKDFLKTCCG